MALSNPLEIARCFPQAKQWPCFSCDTDTIPTCLVGHLLNNLYISHFFILNILLKHNFPTRVDVDECAGGSDACPAQSSLSCVNLIGSYHCNCRAGWRNEDSPTCTDINECSEGSYNCPSNASCVNTQGSYDCQCNRCSYMSGNTCHGKPVYRFRLSKMRCF